MACLWLNAPTSRSRKKKWRRRWLTYRQAHTEGEKYRLSISDSVLESYDDALKAELKAVADAFLATKSSQYIVAHTVKKPSRRHAAKARNGDVE